MNALEELFLRTEEFEEIYISQKQSRTLVQVICLTQKIISVTIALHLTCECASLQKGCVFKGKRQINFYCECFVRPISQQFSNA